MKNIKLFEDFSDEDLEGLFGDLKKIGFSNPVRGMDWGFGPDLKGENDGKTILYINEDCVLFFKNNGILDKMNYDWMEPDKLTFQIPFFRDKLKEKHKNLNFDLVDYKKLKDSYVEKLYKTPPNPDGELFYILIENFVSPTVYFPGRKNTKKPEKEVIVSIYDTISKLLDGDLMYE